MHACRVDGARQVSVFGFTFEIAVEPRTGARFGLLYCEECAAAAAVLSHGSSADDAMRALELHICPPEGDA